MMTAPSDIKELDLSNLAAYELTKPWRQHLRERVPEHLPKSLLEHRAVS